MEDMPRIVKAMHGAAKRRAKQHLAGGVFEDMLDDAELCDTFSNQVPCVASLEIYTIFFNDPFRELAKMY